MKSIELKETKELVSDIENTTKVCQALMNTPHYKKLGGEGIFAIVEKARSIGINPLDALNGGMYFVNGKVEMSSAMMNQMIRNNGHSITKDKRSDDNICILHGRRKDNGDTWVESFSIEDAKRAGIYRNQWLKYPKDMLFARALSRLARQLFPDIIKGCYVLGEISEAPALNEPVIEELPFATIPKDKADELELMLEHNPELKQNILNFLTSEYKVSSLHEMPDSIYEKVCKRVEKQCLPLMFGEEQQQAMEA